MLFARLGVMFEPAPDTSLFEPVLLMDAAWLPEAR